MDGSAFDALHPFSLVTDERGEVLNIGRSLLKIYPEIGRVRRVKDAFALIEPRFEVELQKPLSLVNDLVVVSGRDNPLIRLRGQVVALDSDQRRFMFSFRPDLMEPRQLSALKIDFSDFPIGDPLFDFLIVLKSQRWSRAKLEAANKRLIWQLQVSSIAHSLAFATLDRCDDRAIHTFAVECICRALNWNPGRVTIMRPADGAADAGSSWWVEKDTSNSCMADPTWFPGNDSDLHEQVVRTKRVCIACPTSLEGAREHGAQITVPILIANEVSAIFDFFVPVEFDIQADYLDSLEFLGAHIGMMVARYRALEQERISMAALAQASKMATLGEIAAGVAHEISNPLSTVGLIGQILRKLSGADPLPPETVRLQADRLQQCVDRISKIVSELRAFSRDASRDPFSEVSLRKVIEETLDLCQARCSVMRVPVAVGAIPEEWTVECRPSQISQVVLNLLNNALDAAVESVEPWIRLEVLDRDTAYEIAVTDSGPGVNPAVAKKIMNPFVTTKPMGKGTGLGLSISSNIMVDHGGSLWLEQGSRPTRFVARLPKKQCELN